MSCPRKDDFDRTLQIAEFAAQRLENRRQFEFKIFISYVTLLVLAIYEGHHIKVPDDGYGLKCIRLFRPQFGKVKIRFAARIPEVSNTLTPNVGV